MATLVVARTGDVIHWTISGLQYDFTPVYYSFAGVATSPADGSSTPPAGILDTVYPPLAVPEDREAYDLFSTSLLDPGTYTIYGFAKTPDDPGYWPAGSDTVTIPEPNLRPDDWVWNAAELEAFNNGGLVTALLYTRWNAFVDRITAFRTFKNKSAVSGLAKASAEDKNCTATRFNLARAAIDEMVWTYIDDVAPGDPVLGSYFTTLSDKLNLIQA